jgi:3D (Asp-Asp-Asp) domain-containing protein
MSIATVMAVLLCAAFWPASPGAGPQSRPRTVRPRIRGPIRLTARAYCHHGTTHSGAQTARGTIAADPRVLPPGSVVRIESMERRYSGTYTVTDTGAKVKGRRVDIFLPSCAEARKFGKRVVLGTVLRRGSTGNVMSR